MGLKKVKTKKAIDMGKLIKIKDRLSVVDQRMDDIYNEYIFKNIMPTKQYIRALNCQLRYVTSAMSQLVKYK